MKKLLAFLAILLCCSQVQAQNVEGQIIASQFGEYQVPTVGTGFTFPPASCQVVGANKNFPAFTVGVPIKIVDAQPSQTEVSTPIAVFVTDSNCSVSMSTVNNHSSFYLTSGTGGLQEAINNGVQRNGGNNTIILNSKWYAQVAPSNPATVIASVHGTTSLGLVDVTTSPYSTYSWNGTTYVINPSGGGATTPATSSLLKGSGSINGVLAATPGTDYVIPSGSITGTAGGLTGNPAITASSLTAPTTNSVYYASGFTTSLYPGIGVAQTAWSSGTYPLCSAVSNSGSNYLAVGVTTSVAPGTNSAVWYPVPNGNTPTALDCAWYVAASTVGSTIGSDVELGTGLYPTCIGLLGPTVNGAGLPAVSMHGRGVTASKIRLTCNKTASGGGDGFAALQQPVSPTPYYLARLEWTGFTVDANFNANAAVNLYGSQQSVFRDVEADNVALTNSDHLVEVGTSCSGACNQSGWVYELNMENVDVNQNASHGGNAILSVSVAGGVPTISVTAGGSGFSSTSGVVLLQGAGSNSSNPCTSMGTTTPVFTGGAITSVSTTATGCVSTMYAIAYGSAGNIPYGIKFSNMSDSHFISGLTTGGVGTSAGIYTAAATSFNSFYKVHPITALTGIQDNGAENTWYSPQLDTIYHVGIDIEQATGETNILNPHFEWGSTAYESGQADYLFGKTSNPPTSSPLAINISNEQCGNTPPTGYTHFLANNGSLDAGSAAPQFLHVTNPTYCNQVSTIANQSNYVGNRFSLSNGYFGNLFTMYLNSGNSNTFEWWGFPNGAGVNQGRYNYYLSNPTAATSGQNYPGPVFGVRGTYWDGATSQPSGFTATPTFAAGAGPAETIRFSALGTLPAGGFTYLFDNPLSATSLTATGLTSGNCVQASTGGLLTTTGSACGAGGGSTAWSAITNPSTNLALAMAANTSTFTFNATTGTSDLFKLTDTASNTGTGLLMHLTTASGSNESPWQADANGVGWKVNATGQLASLGTGNSTIAMSGSTSGTITQTVPPVAGTATVTWGNSTGTPAVTATAPLAITASTGNIVCTNCATTSATQTYSALQTFGTNISIGGVTATGATGTGNNVFATSPTLTTPNLGTPSAVTLTNGTGLPWTGLTGTPSTTQVPVQSLTTTGTSGAATLSGGVLNVPQYSGGGGAVSSVFSRTGAVVAASGDYTAAQVTNAAATNVANNFTGAETDSYAGTASTPGLSITGAPFLGTGATSLPQIFYNCAGSTLSTAYSTSGTIFGINTCASSGANLLDFRNNGASAVAKLTAGGQLTLASSILAGGASSLGTGTASTIPLTVYNSATTPTVDLQDWSANSTVVASVGPAGGFKAPTLTATGLTSGNCVQAGSGGLLTTTAAACGTGGVSNYYSATNYAGIGPTSFTPTHTLDVKDATATTGNTSFVVTAGAGQSSYLIQAQNVGGSNYFDVDNNGAVYMTGGINIGGKLGSAGGKSTAGNTGVVADFGAVTLQAQTATLAAQTVVSGLGSYLQMWRISCNVDTHTSAASNSLTVVLGWTSTEGARTQTLINAAPLTSTGTAGSTNATAFIAMNTSGNITVTPTLTGTGSSYDLNCAAELSY